MLISIVLLYGYPGRTEEVEYVSAGTHEVLPLTPVTHHSVSRVPKLDPAFGGKEKYKLPWRPVAGWPWRSGGFFHLQNFL
jgi:hypothetical protein